MASGKIPEKDMHNTTVLNFMSFIPSGYMEPFSHHMCEEQWRFISLGANFPNLITTRGNSYSSVVGFVLYNCACILRAVSGLI